MKSLESALESLKEGSVLLVSKLSNIDEYDASLIRFDGDVLKEVNTVDLGNFLNMFHNILKELDKKNIYQISYDYKTNLYRCAFFRQINNHKSEQKSLQSITELETKDNSLINCIMELDTKIACLVKEKNYPNIKKYRKIK